MLSTLLSDHVEKCMGISLIYYSITIFNFFNYKGNICLFVFLYYLYL